MFEGHPTATFDKQAIEMYKFGNKPKWSTPFINNNLVVATWMISGKPHHTMLDLIVSDNAYGWKYEAN
jgi:hypothetical protein